jgi:small subunit ribosomal protein S7
VRYNSVDVQSFINRVMKGGKKSVATHLVYEAFDMIEERTKRNPYEIFEQALQECISGYGSQASTCRWRYLPGSYGSCPFRRFALASRWILAGFPLSLWQIFL